MLEQQALLIKQKQEKQKNHVNASPASSNPSTVDYVSLGEDSDAFIYQNRPIGQKAAKERLARRQGKEKVGEIYVSNLLEKFTNSIEKIEDKKYHHREKMLEQQAKLIEQNDERQEDEIMKVDTSGMDPMSVAYFENRKRGIMAKRGFNL